MSHLAEQMTPTQKAFFEQIEAAGGLKAADVSDQELLNALIAMGAVEVDAEGTVVAIADEDGGEDHQAEEAHAAAVQPKSMA